MVTDVEEEKMNPPQDVGPPPGHEHKMDPEPSYKAPEYKPAGKLKGKVAVITGGDSGIGRATAKIFAKEGAHVAFVYLNEDKDAEITKQAVEKEGVQALAIKSDLSEYKNCETVVRKIADAFNGIDILVNNIAYQNHVYDFDKLTVEQWDRTLKTNISSYFYMVKSCYPYFYKQASIINVGSIVGIRGSSGLLDYSASKGAILTFTKSLAQMLSSNGIRVNSVAPGPVWTPLNPAERSDEEIKNFGKKSEKGRPAQPDEIAPAMVYLASEADSSYVSGETLVIHGGGA